MWAGSLWWARGSLITYAKHCEPKKYNQSSLMPSGSPPISTYPLLTIYHRINRILMINEEIFKGITVLQVI